MKNRTLLLISPLFATSVLSQNSITTVAGGNQFLDNIPATQARLDGNIEIAIDRDGIAYVGQTDRIRKIDLTGTISTPRADKGAYSFALDGVGNLFFIYGRVLHKLNLANNTLTTIGGSPSGSTPQFGEMSALAADQNGNIFVADAEGGRILRLDPITGMPTPFAGRGSSGASASINLFPYRLTVDPQGNIFFIERTSISRVDGKTGVVTKIATNLNSSIGASGDGGPYASSFFANAASLATDAKGNLYVADLDRLRKIDWATGLVTTIAGGGTTKPLNGIAATQANLGFVMGIAITPQGNVWFGDSTAACVWEVVASTGALRKVAGTTQNGDGGPATGATIRGSGVAVSSQGDIYVAADGIRKIDRVTGTISTIGLAPNDFPPFSYGNSSTAVSLDSANNVFVAKETKVYRIDALSRAVTTVAGNGTGMYGTTGPNGDGGPATDASLTPVGVTVDRDGNLFISDYWNYRIRRVDARTGVITTVAGTGEAGVRFSGIPGPATQVPIGVPGGIKLGPDNNIYWTTNGWILKLDAMGIVSSVAGNGGCVYAGDGGPATLASLCGPMDLAFDNSGNLFVDEWTCGCIRRIEAVTGIIQTVAGTGTRGQSEDGLPPLKTNLTPRALAFHDDALYFVDFEDGAGIRMLSSPTPPPLPQPPSVTQITNAIDFRQFFSPGAIVSIFGNYLAPEVMSGQIGPGGLTTALGGSEALVNGIQGPLLYASPAQINTVLPYSTRVGTAAVQVKAVGGISPTSNVQVTATSLSMFHNLVFNPNGTINSPSNPAPKGATLVMYGTGMGQTDPAGRDGAIAQAPYPQPVARFAATLSQGVTKYQPTIQYLGALPGFVAGAVQANIQLPGSLPAGKSQLTILPTNAQGQVIAQGTSEQDIYTLSDSPVISSISPTPPVSQEVGTGYYLKLNGSNLSGVKAITFTFNGQPLDLRTEGLSCSANSCDVFLYVNGKGGEYSVMLTNSANQVSTPFMFTMLPY